MSKLEELGGVQAIKNGRPQLRYGDGGSRWAGDCIDALIERIDAQEDKLKSYRYVATRGWLFYHFEHAGDAEWGKCQRLVCKQAWKEFEDLNK